MVGIGGITWPGPRGYLKHTFSEPPEDIPWTNPRPNGPRDIFRCKDLCVGVRRGPSGKMSERCTPGSRFGKLEMTYKNVKTKGYDLTRRANHALKTALVLQVSISKTAPWGSPLVDLPNRSLWVISRTYWFVRCLGYLLFPRGPHQSSQDGGNRRCRDLSSTSYSFAADEVFGVLSPKTSTRVSVRGCPPIETATWLHGLLIT